MTAGEWTDRLCARLHAAVADAIPAGLGAWEGAWEMVTPAHDRLRDELRLIERGEGDKAKAIHLAEELIAEWRRAGMRWTAMKRQGAA